MISNLTSRATLVFICEQKGYLNRKESLDRLFGWTKPLRYMPDVGIFQLGYVQGLHRCVKRFYQTRDSHAPDSTTVAGTPGVV